MTTPTDPLYPDQWHFDLIGDIETIWDDYSGAGVQVGVYDDGIDYTHEDLDGSYDDSLHVTDAEGDEVDPFPVNFIAAPFPSSDLHGTAVAGIIAAEANGVGGTGVAFGAAITGVNIFGTDVYGNVNGPQEEFLAVVLQGVAFDISQNSWGSTPRQTADSSLAGTGFAADLDAAYALLSAEGRNGLGTVITQAAGNDGLDANRDGVNASRYTITVAATDEDGNVQSYSNYGAPILVAAPAAEVTTDLSGDAGSSDGDYMDDFGGTSAATPVVSGVIALMLEANPGLGWRDVQTILAASASLTGSDPGGPATGFENGAWYVNGADTWNGGGMHVHSSYGYGMVDAYDAVRMAEVWSLFEPVAATSANEQSISSGTRTLGGAGGLAIPDNTASGVSFTLTLDKAIRIEHVALTLDIDSDRIGDLRIVLISPEGTEVVVVLNSNALRTPVDGAWVYGIDSLRGELSAGTWTVQVTDLRDGRVSTLSSATLEVFGATAGADEVHHITDEFRIMLANDPSRAVLTDTNGGSDWLSFATVAGHVALSLVAGQAFAVDGQTWGSLSGASTFENAVSGDGNDTLTGNDAANELHGMRGDDVISGGAGNDNLYGGEDDDSLRGDSGNDSLYGGDGNDSLYGGESHDWLEGGDGTDRLEGWSGNDSLYGGDGNDSLYGGESHDWLEGGDGTDRLEGGSGSDSLYGGEDDDILRGDSGNDSLYGGDGNDSLYGGDGKDRLDGGAGADVLEGGLGDDRYVIGHSGDVIQNETGYSQGGGIDTVESWISFTLPQNVEILRLQGTADLNGTGRGAPEALVGNGGRNVLDGGGGNDQINGKDGNDTLIGGEGLDWLVGEAGEDVFLYRSTAESQPGQPNRDLINGFEHGEDTIDLSAIDASTLTSGNQAFDFIGTTGFSGKGSASAGELRAYNWNNGNFVLIEMDVDGDGRADMQIYVMGTDSMSASDFIL